MLTFKNKYIAIIFFLLFLSPVINFSQTPEIYFDHISIDDGLSQSTILSIIQDSQGFMWIGTHDGLNRYDGYNFLIFKNKISDQKSISSNIIFSLYETKDKTLWIGTNGGGLNKYNVETENFTSYMNDVNDTNSINDNVVRAIFEDIDGKMWIGTNDGGLNLFNRANETFKKFTFNPNLENTISDNTVNAIIQDTDGLLWIATHNGVNIFNPDTEQFTYLLNDEISNLNLSNIVIDLLIDNEQNIWIATKNGLYKYYYVSKKLVHYIHEINDSNSLCHNTITKLFIDNNNQIWIGTSDGLNIYNRENDNFDIYKHNGFLPKTLNHDNISSIYQDNSGIIWIGTWERGLNLYDKLAQKFNLFENKPQKKFYLPDKTVRSIFVDSDSSIWVGYVEGGLAHFDKKLTYCNIYLNDKSLSSTISANTITSIFRATNGELWIGTWDGGLNKVIFSNVIENDKWEKISGFKKYLYNENDNNSITDNSIQTIFEDSKNRLWIGTSNGLNVYDRVNDNFIRINEIVGFHNLSFQAAIQEDSKGNIWIGTWDGLHKINNFTDFEDIEIEVFQKEGEDSTGLCDNRIISLLIDKKGILWAGTFGGGFCKMYFENTKYSFKTFNEDNGLVNNVVYSLFDDNNNNIWLSTNKGISKFNQQTETFTNFDESDGLQDKEFFWGAGFQSKTGEIFFGGISGINSFYPENISDNQYLPPIVITNFKIYNENVEIGENSPLKKSILLTEKIILSHNDKIFSFEFSSLHFSKPDKNQYEYILEGFNKEWIKVSSDQRIAFYTNLDPGKYIFKVRGSNCDGVWNLEGAKIEIIIKPPFWETWIFRITVILFIIVLIFILFKWRLRRISHQKEHLENEVRERISEIYQKNLLLNQQKDEIQTQAEELKAINDELVKLSIVAAETDNAVIITDDKGIIEWFNDGFIRLYGYQFDEFIDLFGNCITKASTNSEIENEFNKLISTRQTIYYENKSITKSGKEVWVQTTLTPIIDEYGNISKIIGIDTDITENKKAEFEIREKNRKIELQNKNIKESIRYAKTIQQAILPSIKQINQYFETFIIYNPKDIVSGDFYWFSNLKINNDEFNLIAVLDCTGHGVPGAFMSMIGNRLLSEIVNEHKIISPSKILNELNIGVCKALNQEENNNDDGMDVCLCSIKEANNKYKIVFSGAKRPLYFIDFNQKELKEFEGDKKTVGGKFSLKSKIEYTNNEVELEINSMLFLTTDGFSDQNNPERKRFRRRKLKDILFENFDKPTNVQKEILENELSVFQLDAEQRDDITLIGIKLKS